MGFAALEGFLNFCAGCFVFSYLVKWGIISELVYRPYTDLIETFVYTRNLMDSRKGLKELPGVTKDSIPSQDTSLMGWRRRIPDYTPTPIVVKMAERKNGMHSDLDLDYKFPKFDDTVREKFGPQYFQIQNFSIPLAISGFAAVLRYVNPVLHVPRRHGMSLASSPSPCTPCSCLGTCTSSCSSRAKYSWSSRTQ